MNKNKIKITKYITLTIGAAVLSVPTIAMVKNGKHEPNWKMVRNSVNANTDYFTFRQINNSEYAITGLSDDGKTQKILSVPGEYNGIKVTTIDAGAFANNATLEKIMISPNTLTVGTLAFYNCSHLSYVYVPTNNTRFLDYSLDTHTTTELKIEAPDDYDLKTMFGIDGNQREASFTYTKSTRPGLIYGTDMPASGLPYIRYFHNMYIYDSIQDITAFTEKESHVNHKITINDSLPYYLLNLWLFWGPIDPTPQKWFQSVIGETYQINPDEWNFTSTKYYHWDRIVYSLNSPNGFYINSGQKDDTEEDTWTEQENTNYSVCHYDLIVNSLGIVESSIYEQDAQYTGSSHDTPKATNVINYEYNNNYPVGRYVGRW